MLGHHAEASLAAMQIGGTFEWSIWSVFSAFEVGTIARVGRLVGAGDRDGARRVARLSLALALGIGAIVALGAPVVIWGLPHVAGDVSRGAIAEAQGYLGVTISASPLVFLAATATAILQAGGDTRTPLAIGAFANVVHVALNRILILGAFGLPAIGARGAGISTAVTFGLEAVLATVALASLRRPVSLRRALADVDAPPATVARTTREEARMLFRVGGPAFVERLFYHVGFLAYALLVTRLGDAAMAANQSLISVESVCFLSADGFGVAAAALVAQKLGAGKVDEARGAAWIAARYAIATLTAFGLGALALRGVILPLFSSDQGVLAAGRSAMPVLTLAQPFMATGLVLAQALRGAGRTRHALGVSFVGAVFVRLTATWFLAFGLGLGLVGVWLGSTTDWFVRTGLLVVLFRRRAFRTREAQTGA
jgi:putative MATE family efflux protein